MSGLKLTRNLFKRRVDLTRNTSSDVRQRPYKVCVVGSGPAGFFTAQYLLKYHPLLVVDIFERRPTPFGNLRYGIAPDHEGAKNATRLFTKIAEKSGRVRFFGNVQIGKDLQVAQLVEAYHAVVLCHGASSDKSLNIPGEQSPNVFSAREFVHWYNGEETYSQLSPCLDVEQVVVVVTRILLKSIDELRKTDICHYALEALAKSRVKKVHLVGRNGPEDVTFTCKEFRELLSLSECRLVLDGPTYQLLAGKGPPSGRRVVNILRESATQSYLRSYLSDTRRQWQIHFYHRPLVILHSPPSNQIDGVRMKYNPPKVAEDFPEGAVTFPEHIMQGGMLIKSIGYKALPIDDAVPFDQNQHIYPNDQGRIQETKGLYCSGWVKTGPVGPPVTLQQSFLTGEQILKDLISGFVPWDPEKRGSQHTEELLRKTGVCVVDLGGWSRIDTEERIRGRKLGKPREKIICTHEMIQIAGKFL